MIHNDYCRGNIHGDRPYETGRPCSQCYEGQTCEKNMCKGERTLPDNLMTNETRTNILDMLNNERRDVRPMAANMQMLVRSNDGIIFKKPFPNFVGKLERFLRFLVYTF